MSNVINYAVAFMGDSSDAYLSGTFSVEEVDGAFTVTAVDITIYDGVTDDAISYTFNLSNASITSTGGGSQFVLALITPEEVEPFSASAYVQFADTPPTYGDPTIIFENGASAFAYYDDSDNFYVTGSQGDIAVGSEIPPKCFTPDTLISTPTGSTPVQDLAIGDLILNYAGQSVPVKWIGTQRFHPAFIGDGLPICISAGSLGNGLPLRDLYVSPSHALYIDDCLLIEAKALINGTTITQVTQWKGDIVYFHIETEHHEIILAEGAPAETFMDNVSRACFNNYAEYQALYPEAHKMIELDLPRVSYLRQLPNVIKAKLQSVAEGLLDQEKVQIKA